MELRQTLLQMLIALGIGSVIASPAHGQYQSYYPGLILPYSNPYAPYPATPLTNSQFSLICPNGVCGLTRNTGGWGGYGGFGGFGGFGGYYYQPYYYPMFPQYRYPVYQPSGSSVYVGGSGSGLSTPSIPTIEIPSFQAPPSKPKQSKKINQFGEPPAVTSQTTDYPKFDLTPVPSPVIEDKTGTNVNVGSPDPLCIDRKKEAEKRNILRRKNNPQCTDGKCPEGSSLSLRNQNALDFIVHHISPSGKQVAEAFRRMLATAYRNCDLYDIDALSCADEKIQGINSKESKDSVRSYIKEEMDVLRKTHPLLPAACKEYPNKGSDNVCIQAACENPLIFNFGGGPKSMNPQDGALVLNLNAVQKQDKRAGAWNISTTGMDCTHTLCAGYARAGLACAPINKNATYMPYAATSQLISNAVNGTGCFDIVKLSKDETLQPGDSIVRNGHAMFIEAVGHPADPFGLGELPKKDGKPDCSQVSRSHFNFTLIQSTGVGDRGLVRSLSSEYYKSGDDRSGDYLERIAGDLCEAQKTKGSVPGRRDNDLVILRHKEISKPDSAPSCKLAKPAVFDGENECMKGCFKNAEGT